MGDATAVHNCLTREEAVRLFSELHSGTARGNKYESEHGKFGMDIRTFIYLCIYIAIRVAKH